MPELNIEPDTNPTLHKKLMSSSWVKSRLCCCCYSDGKGTTNPVTLTKAEPITSQPTTSAGAEFNRLSNANGHAKHDSHTENASLGEEFDEIDLTEVRLPISTSFHDNDHLLHLKNRSSNEPMHTTVAAGVTDMMLDEIFEESVHEKSDPIEEPDDTDHNAIMEATDEEVKHTLHRKTKSPRILAKMEGEILRVEKLEPDSPEFGGRLQRSSVMNNLDTLKPIDSDSVNSTKTKNDEDDHIQKSPIKPPRINFEEKVVTVHRNNPFDEEGEEKNDETKYSMTESVEEKHETNSISPVPNPSTDTILSPHVDSIKEVDFNRKSPEVEISPISESEKIEPETRESESKMVINISQELQPTETVLLNNGEMKEKAIGKRKPKKSSSIDEGLSTDEDETTTASTDYELNFKKAKELKISETLPPTPPIESVHTTRMYGNISSEESSSESESESIAPERVNKSPNRVSIKKNNVVITKVSIDNHNRESPSTDRSQKKNADYVVLTDDEFSEKII